MAVISVLILTGGVAASVNLRTILQDAILTQMEGEAERYGINIRRQIDSDIQTLDTLAGFLQYSNMSTEEFIKGFRFTQRHNDFKSMGFFGKNGEGISVLIGSDGEREVQVDELDERAADIVRNAWEGRSGISGIYDPADTEENMVAYAVPVYADDMVVGALTALAGTDRFADVLEGGTFLNKNGYIHLISESGRILVRSEKTDRERKVRYDI